MSAILGRVNFDGAPIQKDRFRRAFEVMAHYGGDGANIWVDDAAGLGHHLLQFTPESSYEQQPHHWDDAVIVADARIDNRDDLVDRFDLPPEDRSITPDSHLILRAYRLWDDDCTDHLVGDFAFAIWDQRKQRVFCACDHAGARPLYYYHTPAMFVCATDIRALQAFPDVNSELDDLEVAMYLTWWQNTEKRTSFKHIYILQPGQQLIANASGLTRHTYWMPDRVPDVHHNTLAEYQDHFRWLLETAVAARIRTSHPVAAHVSGGVDSSGVAILANRHLRQQGRSLDMAYSWTPARSDAYPPIDNDERDRIEAVCDQEQIPCQYGMTTGEGYREFLTRDIAAELPNLLFEELPVMAHAGKRGIRTILSGWGGDEVATFAGRGHVAYLLKHGHLREVLQITRRKVGIRRPGRIIRYLFRYGLVPLLPDRLYNLVDPNHRPDRESIYIHPAFAARFPHVKNFRSPAWREVADPRQLQIRLLQNGHIADRMASWSAWSSEHGLVYAYPLTDRRVLEFALGLPPDILYRPGITRALYLEALDDLIPFRPQKADPVHELKRLECWSTSWRILAGEVQDGIWTQDDVPWLALDVLRDKLRAVPDDLSPDSLLAFVSITPPIKVWHLWQRYGNSAGADSPHK